jgi:hypothetical protein
VRGAGGTSLRARRLAPAAPVANRQVSLRNCFEAETGFLPRLEAVRTVPVPGPLDDEYQSPVYKQGRRSREKDAAQPLFPRGMRRWRSRAFAAPPSPAPIGCLKRRTESFADQEYLTGPQLGCRFPRREGCDVRLCLGHEVRGGLGPGGHLDHPFRASGRRVSLAQNVWPGPGGHIGPWPDFAKGSGPDCVIGAKRDDMLNSSCVFLRIEMPSVSRVSTS